MCICVCVCMCVCVCLCLCKIYLKQRPVSNTIFPTNSSFDVLIKEVSELQLSPFRSLTGGAERKVSTVSYTCLRDISVLLVERYKELAFFMNLYFRIMFKQMNIDYLKCESSRKCINVSSYKRPLKGTENLTSVDKLLKISCDKLNNQNEAVC